jgi:glutamine synthetase
MWHAFFAATLLTSSLLSTPSEQNVLADVVQEAWRLGYNVRISCSLQLYVGSVYEYSFIPVHIEKAFIEQLQLQLKKQRVPCLVETAEIPGLLMLKLREGDAFDVASFLVKSIENCKQQGGCFGYAVTTMSKPGNQLPHAGIEITISLIDVMQQKNAFADSHDTQGLSYLVRQFAAGILHEIRGMEILLRPTVTAYKSIVPRYVAWGLGARHKNVACAVTSSGIMVRDIDACAPMYLVCAALIKAGLQGIMHQLELEKPLGDIYAEYSTEKACMLSKQQLASSGEQALEQGAQSDFMRDWLGDVWENFLDDTRAALHEYHNWVTDWERKRYL